MPLVWIADEKAGYVQALAETQRSPGGDLLATVNGAQVPAWLGNPDQDGIADLTHLSHINVPAITFNLHTRFDAKKIYTQILNNVLVSINPYQFTDVFSDANLEKYAKAEKLDGLDAHIYKFARHAYETLKKDKKVSIFAFGRSGAGKSESIRQILRYLSHNQGANGEKILAGFQALQYLGNARTPENVNSSRFVNSINLYYDEKQTITSVQYNPILFQTSRVSDVGEKEKNYHLLHSLIHIINTSSDVLKFDYKLNDKKNTDFVYLKSSAVAENDVANDFLKLLVKIGLKSDELEEIFRILTAVLYLGNSMPFQKQGYKPSSVVENLAHLLAIPVPDLVENLAQKKTTSKGHSVSQDRTPPAFLTNRDLIAKYLYLTVVQTIASKINSYVGDGKATQQNIHLIDCVGFTESAHPYEQLCINFAAEKFNNLFIRRTVVVKQEQYEQEYLLWKTVLAPERSQCFELLEKPPADNKSTSVGLFYLLIEGRKNNSNTKKLLENFVNGNKYNRFMFVPEIVQKKNPTAEEKRKLEQLEISFGVHHYAASITYDTSEFMKKDVEDNADEQICALLGKSGLPLLKSKSKYDDANNPAKNGTGLNYSKQLKNVISQVTDTTCMFVACLSPNPARSQSGFDFKYVSNLVQTESLVAVTQINKYGYEFIYPYQELFDKFKKFLDAGEAEPGLPPWYFGKATVKFTGTKPRYIHMKDFVEGILYGFGIHYNEFQQASNKIFIRYHAKEKLEYLFNHAVDASQASQLKETIKFLIRKRMIRLRGCVRLGNFLRNIINKRNASFTLQSAIQAALAWQQRDRQSNIRKISANTIIAFLEWKIHQRPVGVFKSAVARVVKTIQEERQEEKERAERQHERWKVPPFVLADLAYWLQGLTKRPCPSTLIPALRDGELLCDLLILINPAVKIDGIRRGKKQAFFWRENVGKFLSALAIQLSCPANNVFSIDDLLSDIKPNYKPVVYTLQWIARYTFLKNETELPGYMAAKLESGDVNTGEGTAASEEMFWEETPEERRKREARQRAREEAERKRAEREKFEEEKKKKQEEIKFVASQLEKGFTFDILNADGEKEKRYVYLTDDGLLKFCKLEDKEQPQNHKHLDLNKGVTLYEGKLTPWLSKKVSDDDELCFAIIANDDNNQLTCLECIGEDLESKKQFFDALAFLAKWKYNELSPEEVEKTLAKQREQMMSIEDQRRAREERERREREEAERLAAMLRRLQENWRERLDLLIKGDNFKQYRGQRVLTRNVLGSAPKKLNLEEITFEVLLDNIKDFKLLFTAPEDRMDVSALLPFPQLNQIIPGKKDEEKCFPTETADDEKVIEENKCLIITTKTRPIGLESDDEKKRDSWVDALQWAIDMMKYEEMKKKFELEATEKHVGSLDPILLAGAWFSKHGLRGVNKRFIKCTPTHVYWLKQEGSALSECVDPIAWDSVSEVRQGKQTLMFSRARAAEVPDSHCLSIVYRSDKRTLDLEAESAEQAFEWYQALSSYLSEIQAELEKVLAVKRSEKEKLIAEAKDELEKQRRAYQEEVGAISANLEDAQKALDERKSALEAAVSTIEADVSKVGQERDELIATVEELTKRFNKLREQLEDSLHQKSDFLIELSRLQEEKLQYPAIRAELEKEKLMTIQQTRQLDELAEILRGSLIPKWSELDQAVQQDLVQYMGRLSTISASA